MANPIHVQIRAHDKHSDELRMRSLEINSKEDANSQIEEFEADVPYKSYYVEIEPEETLNAKQEGWLSDQDWNY